MITTMSTMTHDNIVIEPSIPTIAEAAMIKSTTRTTITNRKEELLAGLFDDAHTPSS